MIHIRRLTKVVLTVAIGAVALFTVDRATGQSRLESITQREQISERLGLRDFSVQTLQLSGQEGGTRSVAKLDLDGQVLNLELKPHSMRALNFQLLTHTRNGRLEAQPTPPVRTYRGTVVGDPHTHVIASIRNEQITAHIFDGAATWWVQPMTIVDPKAEPTWHIVYRQGDVVGGGNWTCGVVGGNVDAAGGGIAGGGGPSDCLHKAQIAFDADFEYYSLFDGSEDQVGAVMDDIESLMNTVEFIFQRDCGITYEITAIVVQTAEPDPYFSTDPYVQIDEFSADWIANHTDIVRDVAHLMTGKDLDGSIIGLASRPGVCTEDGYGLSQSHFTTNEAWRVGLTAHELGHNWNAMHCDQSRDPKVPPPCLDTCNIMCHAIASCADAKMEFESCSRDVIIAYRDSLTCLETGSSLVPELNRVVSSDILPGDHFGASVAAHGNLAIVGAHEDDAVFSNAGAAYVFRYDPQTATWAQEAKLMADDDSGNDRFGIAVDITDGGTEVAIVGAYQDDQGGGDSGAAYIFEHEGSNWVQKAKLVAGDPGVGASFGRSVAIGDSGSVAIVGSYLHDVGAINTGAAYIFRNNGGTWEQEQRLTADDAVAQDQLGYSVAIGISPSGEEVAVAGAFMDDVPTANAGSAYVFTNSGSTWSQTAKLISSHPAVNDQFGDAVDIQVTDAETYAVVGAWQVEGKGNISNVGKVFVFRKPSGGSWSVVDELSASDHGAEDHFGSAVSIAGDSLVIGSYLDDNPNNGSGSAYRFTKSGLTFVQAEKILPQTPADFAHFGLSASITADGKMAIGAWNEPFNGADAGGAYLSTIVPPFPDCNENDVSDSCDIFNGTSFDSNADGIPDECAETCATDVAPPPSGNGVTDVDDLLAIINAWGLCDPPPAACAEDIAPPGGNGVVDVDDLLAVINGWGLCD